MKNGVKVESVDMSAEEKKLLADIQKYRQMAIDLGVEDVRIVTPADIVQNVRPRFTCIFGHCPGLGTSYFCPPNWEIPWEYQKDILTSYRYILIYRVSYPREGLGWRTGPASGAELEGMIYLYERNWPDEAIEYWRGELKNRTPPVPPPRAEGISIAIEKEARKDGHQFAFTGFRGACSLQLCNKLGRSCSFLTGGQCRFPGKVRPDGAGAMNIDYMRTNAKQGWLTWNGGWSVLPEDFPERVEPYICTSHIMYID